MVGSGVRVDVTPVPKGLIIIESEMPRGHTSLDIREAEKSLDGV